MFKTVEILPLSLSAFYPTDTVTCSETAYFSSRIFLDLDLNLCLIDLTSRPLIMSFISKKISFSTPLEDVTSPTENTGNQGREGGRQDTRGKKHLLSWCYLKVGCSVCWKHLTTGHGVGSCKPGIVVPELMIATHQSSRCLNTKVFSHSCYSVLITY